LFYLGKGWLRDRSIHITRGEGHAAAPHQLFLLALLGCHLVVSLEERVLARGIIRGRFLLLVLGGAIVLGLLA
jgi:hypothetical protein